MNRITTIIIILFFFVVQINAQDSTDVESGSTSEIIALWTMTGIIVPLAIAGVVISAVPPSISIVSQDGISYGALNFETGFGFGEKRITGVFSDWRIGTSYSYIFNSNVRDVFRIELKKDFHFDFVDRRKILLSGFHFSAGLMTDFPNDGYTIGTGAWLKSPWLPFFGLFPEHTYGITYRYNKYFGGKDFHEISLGVTSAFTF
ncbi:MAG TPA: hypothetical protein DCQ28_05925 [Bacteroidetes bacterium]|nr:hypothetical protein [Bacteroidota bacterium]